LKNIKNSNLNKLIQFSWTWRFRWVDKDNVFPQIKPNKFNNIMFVGLTMKTFITCIFALVLLLSAGHLADGQPIVSPIEDPRPGPFYPQNHSREPRLVPTFDPAAEDCTGSTPEQTTDIGGVRMLETWFYYDCFFCRNPNQPTVCEICVIGKISTTILFHKIISS